MLAFASGSCGPGSERAVAEAHVGTLRIELDERPVLVGDVVERIETASYVYLRLSIVSDSATASQRPHAIERWVALEGEPPALGERIRVRSLARRSDVWDPAINRNFEVLEYVGSLTTDSHHSLEPFDYIDPNTMSVEGMSPVQFPVCSTSR